MGGQPQRERQPITIELDVMNLFELHHAATRFGILEFSKHRFDVRKSGGIRSHGDSSHGNTIFTSVAADYAEP